MSSRGNERDGRAARRESKREETQSQEREESKRESARRYEPITNVTDTQLMDAISKGNYTEAEKEILRERLQSGPRAGLGLGAQMRRRGKRRAILADATILADAIQRPPAWYLKTRQMRRRNHTSSGRRAKRLSWWNDVVDVIKPISKILPVVAPMLPPQYRTPVMGGATLINELGL